MRGLERIAYRDGSAELTGWLARTEAPLRGAFVLFPTIANINPHMERRAAMLADSGFEVLIADFYGIQPESFEHAGKLASTLRETPEGYRQRLRAAANALRNITAAPMGALGYCMGGQAAIELARDGADLVLAASFHGLLDTKAPAQAGSIRPRLLVCHGDMDPMAPRDQVLAFWEEMDRAGADWHFHSYSGTKHGFTDPESDARGLPAIAYDSGADRQSWAALMSHCDELFG